MKLKNIDDVIAQLHTKLPEYLESQLGHRVTPKTRFPCFVHGGDDPNMGLNAATNFATAHCFSHNCEGDIIKAATFFENLPGTGPSFVETVKTLAERFDIKMEFSAITPLDAEKQMLYNIAADITKILSEQPVPQYAIDRNWVQNSVPLGQISDATLMSKLVSIGYNPAELNASMLIRTANQSYFGTDKVTFAILNASGKPCGFITRQLGDKLPKYINTPETAIYSKSKTLMGLNDAIGKAKSEGLILVEGPADMIQLKRLGITNCAAVCGTAITKDHILMLKGMGILKIILCLDWDTSGQAGIERFFFNTLKEVQGVNIYVMSRPPGSDAKDMDELLRGSYDTTLFKQTTITSAFEWAIQALSDKETADTICQKMVPIIAAEPAATRREMQIKKLSEAVGISFHAIRSDVETMRNIRHNEKKDRLMALADQYKSAVETDPDNVLSIFSNHEQDVMKVFKDYEKAIIGPDYQLSRMAALQAKRAEAALEAFSFKMEWFPEFAKVLSGGGDWTSGCYTIVGGEQNAGKTGVCLAIGTDIAHHDEDAIVMIHCTDDAFEQVEPRQRMNLMRMMFPNEELPPFGAIVNPAAFRHVLTSQHKKMMSATDDRITELLSTDRLVILDAEDGTTTSVVEKQLRYYRQQYPSRKIVCITDGVHNMTDNPHLEQTQRITQISTAQKNASTKYHASFISTAEYRKFPPRDTSKMYMPTNDDLADARALKYRPNIIFHVYNDVNSRASDATVFNVGRDNKIMPRLILRFSKNKITSFKGDLVMDLDIDSVTLKQTDLKTAMEATSKYSAAKKDGGAEIINQRLVTKQTEYVPEEDLEGYDEDYVE